MTTTISIETASKEEAKQLIQDIAHAKSYQTLIPAELNEEDVELLITVADGN